MTTCPMHDQIPYLVAAANRQFDGMVLPIIRPEGLTIETWRILCTLAEQPGQPMTSLADGVLVEAATLTKIIDRMVSDALVHRAPDPPDRRRVLIYPTPRGAALHQRLAPLVAARLGHIDRCLSPNDVAALRVALERLRQGKSERSQRSMAPSPWSKMTPPCNA